MGCRNEYMEDHSETSNKISQLEEQLCETNTILLALLKQNPSLKLEKGQKKKISTIKNDHFEHRVQDLKDHIKENNSNVTTLEETLDEIKKMKATPPKALIEKIKEIKKQIKKIENILHKSKQGDERILYSRKYDKIIDPKY